MQTESMAPPAQLAFRDTPFRLVASDGYSLGATLFEPTSSSAYGTVVIHGATATPARYYRRFAEFLAGRGHRVLTYDYRGVGESRPGVLRELRATMSDWARKDASSVHRYLGGRLPGEPVAIVGHSFGGQLLGLLDEGARVKGALLVGAQLGYYGHWPALARLKLRLVWSGLVPALTAALGYLPGWLGLGEDLPAGVAREWAMWCGSPGYFISHVPGAADRFGQFRAPILNYSFADDDFAPRPAVDALIEHFRRAPVDQRWVDPAQHGGAPIGHFGFFRPRFRQTLWTEASEFLATVLDGDAAVAPARALPRMTLEDVMEDLSWGRA